MATNEQGDLICVQCSNLLSGRQTLYCSDKCRTAYKRTRSKANDRANDRATGQADSPEVEPGLKRTTGRTTAQPGKQSDTFVWRDEYHQMKGERDRLLAHVEKLEESNRQLTAAAIDKAKFEGAYNALLASNEQQMVLAFLAKR